MSADMFQRTRTKSTTDDFPSRIPIPRSGSSCSLYSKYNSRNNLQDSVDNISRITSTPTSENTLVKPSLYRGHSFTGGGSIHREQNSHGRQIFLNTRSRNSNTDHRTSTPRKGATTPKSPSRQRSLSLSLSNTSLNNSQLSSLSPKTPPNTANSKHHYNNDQDWDTDSLISATSSINLNSCDHSAVARNGTTFSGRTMKYVLHCNQYSGVIGEDYLTPTQRAHRQVKKLKLLLHQARKDLEQKDSDILKLTKELVELRLIKAALSSPEDRSNSSDAVTVRENLSDEKISPNLELDRDTISTTHLGDMSSSCTDSGHFDDFSIQSKSSAHLSEESPSKHENKTAEKTIKCTGNTDQECEHHKLIAEYERRLHELIKTHEESLFQLKQKSNDKIEELLQRITDISTKYWEMVPELQSAKDKITELEQQLEEASKKLKEKDDSHKSVMQMYNQPQGSATLEPEKKMESLQSSPSRVSVPELLHQLQVTKKELDNIKDLEYASSSNSSQVFLSAKEALSLWVLGARKAMYRQLIEAKSKNKVDPEITLQFLKSAIYYFLTDKENSHGHLKAIQSILGFTQHEIESIDKALLS